MSKRNPVVLTRPDGVRLAGMYNAGDGPDERNVAILLLSPGVKMRVAPHRQYVRLADTLSAAGWPVLRFDFAGLGDSEGERQERLHSELYTKIQLGLYVDDVVTAMNWLERQGVGERGFVLAGLCGGAITGLLAAAEDPRVKGLLSFGIPVMLDDRGATAETFISAGQLNKLRSGYLRRLRDPQAWLRLLSFRTDYRLLIKSLLQRSRKRSENSGGSAGHDSRNPRFAPAFLSLLERGVPINCIFGGSDRLHWEFEEEFLSQYREAVAEHEEFFELNVTDGANHIFAWREWEEELLSLSFTWLNRWFGTLEERDEDVAA